MCDSDSGDSGGGGYSGGDSGGGGYSPDPTPSFTPDPTPYVAPEPRYTPPPEPSTREESFSPTHSPNPEHHHENTSDSRPEPEPAHLHYPAGPTAAELFLADLALGTVEELLYDEEESYDEYYDRTGRRYHGTKQSGVGRTRQTSVPGKHNLATTARSPARSPDLSPASRDTDTIPVTVTNSSSTGRNVAIVCSVLVILGILASFII